MTRSTLRSFTTARECFNAITALEKGFRNERKRNLTIALCYSLSGPQGQDHHAVTLHVEDPIAQQGEMEWVKQAILSL